MGKIVEVCVLPANVRPFESLPVYQPGQCLKGTGVYARVRAAFKEAFPGIKGAALRKSVDEYVHANRPALNALFTAKVNFALEQGVAGRIRQTASGKTLFEVEPLKVNKLAMSDEQLIALAKQRGLRIEKPVEAIESHETAEKAS